MALARELLILYYFIMEGKVTEAPKVDASKEVKQEGDFKIKKSKPSYKDVGLSKQSIAKVDFSKKTQEDAIQVGELSLIHI